MHNDHLNQQFILHTKINVQCSNDVVQLVPTNYSMNSSTKDILHNYSPTYPNGIWIRPTRIQVTVQLVQLITTACIMHTL